MTTPTRPRHKTVKARDLRADDLMQIGVTTTYVQVTSVTVMPGGQIDVRTGRGEPGQLMHPDADVSLSTFAMTDAEIDEDRSALPVRPVDYRELVAGDRYSWRPEGPLMVVTRVEHLASGASMIWHETPEMPAGSTDRFTLQTPGLPAYGACTAPRGPGGA